MHAGVLVVMCAAVAGLFLTPPLEREVLFVLLAFLPAPAIVVGMRVHRVRYRTPWWLAVVAMLCLTVGNLSQLMLIWSGSQDSFGRPVMLGLMLAAFMMLLAAAIQLVLRHAPHDRGRVIDAALIGLVGAGVIWEAVLLPRLAAYDAPVLKQSVVLVQVLSLLGIVGALLKVVRVEPRGRGPVGYMFLAILTTLINVVVTATLPVPGGGPLRATVSAVWAVSYLAFGAAALHPGVGLIGVADDALREDLAPTRLAYLGAALWASPMLGAVPIAFGRPADLLLICVGPLMIIPLVLLRIRQITNQRARDQEALAYQAAHDELTGLPNRRAFFQLVEEAVNGGEPVAILYCDLDGFKPINDSYGHRAGDEVLRAVAGRLRACVRGGDVVGRVGGDEFLVLTRAATERECREIAGRIRATSRTPMSVHGLQLTVGITVGYAASQQLRVGTADALVAAADEAMYARKRRQPQPAPRGAVAAAP